MSILGGVIWDMDGVLVDTGEFHYQSWRDTLNEYQVFLTKNRFYETFGMNNRSILQLLLGDRFTEQLCDAARENEIFVVIGANERNSETSNSSIYNSMLYIDDHGEILGVHRKLIPTGGDHGDKLLVIDVTGRIDGDLGGILARVDDLDVLRTLNRAVVATLGLPVLGIF